jgi:hypothetical protein
VNVGEKSFPVKSIQSILYSGHWGRDRQRKLHDMPVWPAYQSGGIGSRKFIAALKKWIPVCTGMTISNKEAKRKIFRT